jgi:hypothetical protein
LNGKELSGRQIGVVQYRSRQKDGAAGMAKGTDDGFETGSAMSVEVDDEVDDGFNVPDNEYMDWNYGMAFFSSESLSTSSPREITGLIDSGCSDHLSPTHLPDHRDQSTPIRFSIADGKHIYSTGDRGSLSGYANTEMRFQLHQVHYVPHAKQTLISVHQLLLSGHDVWFDHSDMSVNIGNINSKTIIANDFAQHGVFPLTIRNTMPATALLSKGVLLPPGISWHKR